jgi:protein phosphatase 1G
MEDSHISNLNFDEDKAIFGVFDGHGGKEVAKYVEKYFI